jgi:hypothetical protein
VNNHSRGPGPISIQSTDHQPACPNCGTPALLSAHVPHGWANPDGTTTTGTIPVLLCEQCDLGRPGAAPLITYFQVDGQIDAATVSEAAALIHAWAASITIPAADLAQLEAEALAWRSDDL